MPLVREFETNFESGFAAADGGFADAEREERRRTIINWNGSDLSYDSENSTRKRQTHVIDALCATAAASNLYWPTSPKKIISALRGKRHSLVGVMRWQNHWDQFRGQAGL